MDEVKIAILKFLDGTTKKFAMRSVLPEIRIPRKIIPDMRWNLEATPIPFRLFKLDAGLVDAIEPGWYVGRDIFVYREVSDEGRCEPE